MKKILLLVLTALMLVGCETINEYRADLTISLSYYTFDWDDQRNIEVNITADKEWTYECESAEWLIVERDGDKLKLNVEINETAYTREARVSVESGISEEVLTITQLPYSFESTFRELPLGNNGTISRNGKFLAYIGVSEDPSSAYQTVLINLETNEKSILEGIPMDYDPTKVFYNMIVGVSNDGTTLALSSALSTRSALYQNGNIIELAVPSDEYAFTTISGMSDDGRVVVGWARQNSIQRNVPMVWKNGVPIVLPFPDELYSGTQTASGAMARGCSGDGSIIYGATWSMEQMLLWKNEELLDYIDEYAELITVQGTTVANSLTMPALTNAISPNGKYLVCDYTTWNTGTSERCPAYIDLETREVKILSSIPNARFNAASDNGTFFGQKPYRQPSSGFVVTVNDNNETLLQTWMQENWGLDFGASRFILRVGENDNTYYGYNILRGTAGQGINQYWLYKNE